MLAKIDAFLAPFVRWTIIILGGGIAILLFLFVPVVPSPGTSAGAEETFRRVQAALDAQDRQFKAIPTARTANDELVSDH